MQRQNHPLNEEFDIDNPVFDAAGLVVTIPEIAELKTITDLALSAYQMIIQNLVYVEPDNRIRQMEVAHKYLSEAKDAIYKAEQVRIKLLSSAKSDDPAKPTTTEPSGNQQSTVNREELFKRVK